jgi:hypothetical protein
MAEMGLASMGTRLNRTPAEMEKGDNVLCMFLGDPAFVKR